MSKYSGKNVAMKGRYVAGLFTDTKYIKGLRKDYTKKSKKFVNVKQRNSKLEASAGKRPSKKVINSRKEVMSATNDVYSAQKKLDQALLDRKKAQNLNRAAGAVGLAYGTAKVAPKVYRKFKSKKQNSIKSFAYPAMTIGGISGLSYLGSQKTAGDKMNAKQKAKAVIHSKEVGVNHAMESAKTPQEKRAILKALRDKKMQKTASAGGVGLGALIGGYSGNKASEDKIKGTLAGALGGELGGGLGAATGGIGTTSLALILGGKKFREQVDKAIKKPSVKGAKTIAKLQGLMAAGSLLGALPGAYYGGRAAGKRFGKKDKQTSGMKKKASKNLKNLGKFALPAALIGGGLGYASSDKGGGARGAIGGASLAGLTAPTAMVGGGGLAAYKASQAIMSSLKKSNPRLYKAIIRKQKKGKYSMIDRMLKRDQKGEKFLKDVAPLITGAGALGGAAGYMGGTATGGFAGGALGRRDTSKRRMTSYDKAMMKKRVAREK